MQTPSAAPLDASMANASVPVTGPGALPSLSASYAVANQPEGVTSGSCTNLAVTNPGTAAVQSMSYAVAPVSDFATCPATAAEGVPACAGAIPGGSRCNIGVHLRTATAGLRNGTLTLSSANGSPATVTSAIQGTYAGPAATASNTSPDTDSPGSSYVYASNNGGTVVQRYYDNDETTGMGVERNGYTGVKFPKPVRISGLALSLSIGSYGGSEYRSATLWYTVHYLDASGTWQYLPQQLFNSTGAFGIPRGQPQSVVTGDIVASDIRVSIGWSSSDVRAAGVTTFRPLY